MCLCVCNVCAHQVAQAKERLSDLIGLPAAQLLLVDLSGGRIVGPYTNNTPVANISSGEPPHAYVACLFVCLVVCLLCFVCLSVCLFVCLSVCLVFVCLFVSLFVCVSLISFYHFRVVYVHLSVCLYFCPRAGLKCCRRRSCCPPCAPRMSTCCIDGSHWTRPGRPQTSAQIYVFRFVVIVFVFSLFDLFVGAFCFLSFGIILIGTKTNTACICLVCRLCWATTLL